MEHWGVAGGRTRIHVEIRFSPTLYQYIEQVPVSSAGKEWRGHVDQTKKHEDAIQAALPVTSTQLQLIGNEVMLMTYRFPVA